MSDAVMEMEFDFDPSVVNDVDQGSVERTESEYPTIQWHRGEPKAKKYGGMDYQGGFFVAESQAPADLTEYGWEKVTWTHDSGDETEGYYRREVTVAVVRDRQRWEVFENNQRSIYAWNDYDTAKAAGRASGRSHTLVVIKGMEALGPFIITLRGMAGVYFYNRKNAPKCVLGMFDSVVMKAANDKVKNSGIKGRLMPRRAFWLTLGASRDDKGAPVFIEVGSGNDKSYMVVPQAIGLPEKAEQVNLKEYYVGPDMLAQLSQLWADATDWAKAWDNIKAGTVEGGGEDDSNKGKSSSPSAATATPEATDEAVKELGF